MSLDNHSWKICNLQREKEENILSKGGEHAPEESEVVRKLRNLMDRVESIKSKRKELENKIREGKYNGKSNK